MTAVTLDVRDLAPVDRAETLRAAVGPSILWVDADHHTAAAGAIAVQGLIRRAGRLTRFSARTTPPAIRHTPGQTRDGSEARLVPAVQRSGTATVVQNGRQAVVRPGDLVVVDSSRPFTAVAPDGTHHHSAGIGGEFGISVRHLHAVLTRSGIEPGEWPRARRLEACRADPAAPHKHRPTIASVTRGHGFCDAGRFGRLFKEACGIPPGGRRMRSRPADGTRA